MTCLWSVLLLKLGFHSLCIFALILTFGYFFLKLFLFLFKIFYIVIICDLSF